jgi:hypothetical protein
VVTVSQSATGRTEWFGSANVTVSTTVNAYMSNIGRVHILPPTKMEIVEHIVEAEIGVCKYIEHTYTKLFDYVVLW